MLARSCNWKIRVANQKRKTPSCESKVKDTAREEKAIPKSWQVNDQQRCFIESLMEPKNK